VNENKQDDNKQEVEAPTSEMKTAAEDATRRAASAGDSVTTSPIPVGTHFIAQSYLYAFAPRHEIQNYIRTQARDDERKRMNDILRDWEKVQPRIQTLGSTEATVAQTIGIQDIPSEHRGKIEAIQNDPLFSKTFAGHQISFHLVEIDKVVAAQRTVNLRYVEKLTARLGKKPTMSELVDFFLSPAKTAEPIQHLEVVPNVHVFTSPNADLRFLGAFQKDITHEDFGYAVAGGLPAAGVIAFIGYGASSVNAFIFADKVFLNNGFHRVYAARQLGLRHIPMVLQHVSNPQLEFPPVIAGVPREYLLGVPRPVLMKDFFEKDFVITLKIRDRIRMVMVQVNANQHDVPV
jgi:amyloid precursor-like protein